MKTMHDRINDYGITMTVKPTDHNPHMDDSEKMDHWRCTLRRDGRRLTIIYSMGSGHNGKEPTAADVLNCLTMDAGLIESADGFEGFCSDLGYDADSRKAERNYRQCVRQTERFKAFIGADLEDLLYDTESL